MIQKWLESPNFPDGLEILKQTSISEARLFLFEQGLFSLQDLIKEIQSFFPLVKKKQIKNKTKNKSKPLQQENKILPKISFATPISDLPPLVQDYKKSADIAYKKARQLHGNILISRSRSKRAAMAAEIVELTNYAFENWSKIDYFLATNDISVFAPKKEKTEIDHLSIFEMIILIKNIPSYITKFKKQLPNSASATKTEKLMREIAERELQLKNINERLKYLDNKIKELNL